MKFSRLYGILEVNSCSVYIFHEYGLSMLIYLHLIDFFVIIYVILN